MPVAILAAVVSFVEVDPGHFHAALVLNRIYPGVSREVKVFAPKGPELDAHLALVRDFNGREKDPTDWNETVCTGEDYLARAVAAHTDGAVAILAGRNDLKPDYELAMAKAGYHILADKPMAVTPEGFAKLEETVRECERRGTLVDDIMTERHEITTILQRELSRDRAVYGEQELGTPGDPAITKESVHHFCKLVNGKPLTRPGWFYDVTKEGEGITDVTTHLVDLIQWEAFPEVPLVREDVKMLAARSWATPITAADYRLSTGLDKWPAYLRGAVNRKNVLQCRANGEFTYRLKGVCAKVSVRWNFMPPEGGGDTHYSLMRGTKAELVIRQGKEQGFRPALYVRPRADRDAVGAALASAVARISKTYPGVAVGAFADGAWRIEIPKAYDIGHEAHFSQEVTEFLGWLKNGDRPKWELQNLMVKYWTIREALLLSRQKPAKGDGVIRSPSGISLVRSGKTLWSFNVVNGESKPFIHPLTLPDGRVITDARPKDHPWHLGLWFCWKFLNGVNYWEPSDDHRGLLPPGMTVIKSWKTRNEGLAATVDMELWYGPRAEPGRVLMDETRRVAFSAPNAEGGYLIRAHHRFTAREQVTIDGRRPVSYGGLGCRLNPLVTKFAAEGDAGLVNLTKNGAVEGTSALAFRDSSNGHGIRIRTVKGPSAERYYMWADRRYMNPVPMYAEPIVLEKGDTLELEYEVEVF